MGPSMSFLAASHLQIPRTLLRTFSSELRIAAPQDLGCLNMDGFNNTSILRICMSQPQCIFRSHWRSARVRGLLYDQMTGVHELGGLPYQQMEGVHELRGILYHQMKGVQELEAFSMTRWRECSS